MNKLIIDTTDSKETSIKLEIDGKIDELRSTQRAKTQDALILIDKILSRNKLKPMDIDEIEVDTGPGSYTGTRVGVAIANALGFSTNTKVNGQKSKIILPRYI